MPWWVRQSGKDRNLEFQTNKEKITGPAIKGNKVWIKSVWGLDGKSQFSYSTDGRKFTPFGDDVGLLFRLADDLDGLVDVEQDAFKAL